MNLLVPTIYKPVFLIYAKLTPSILNKGGASPLYNFTFLKKVSDVFFTNSYLKSLFIIVSPLADKIKNYEIILRIYFLNKKMILK